VRWSATENITWKLPLPSWSGSTPIVWGDRIFLNVAEKGSLYLWAIDRNKGVPLWKQHLSDGDHREMKQNMSTPSAVTDGTNVWVMTGTGILKAFDFSGRSSGCASRRTTDDSASTGGTDRRPCSMRIRSTFR
jgi:outer membrane protein assembly factor BamB